MGRNVMLSAAAGLTLCGGTLLGLGQPTARSGSAPAPAAVQTDLVSPQAVLTLEGGLSRPVASLGALPRRASVGHRPRGLLRRWRLLELVPSRSRAQPRLPLG